MLLLLQPFILSANPNGGVVHNVCVCVSRLYVRVFRFINDSIWWRLPAGITTPWALALPPRPIMRESCGDWRHRRRVVFHQSLHGSRHIWTWLSCQRLKLSERDREKESEKDRLYALILATCLCNLTADLSGYSWNQRKTMTNYIVFHVSLPCCVSARGHLPI